MAYHRHVTTSTTEEPTSQEDVRAATPFILSPTPLKSLLRRILSIVALAIVDVGGLIIGLYLALTLRALVVDPKPILWGLLWNQETSWLAFLILLLVLVFWQAGLYAPREVREGAGRVVPSVVLVTVLSLIFAIGTGSTSRRSASTSRGRVCRSRDQPLPRVLRERHRHVDARRGRADGMRCSSATSPSSITCARRSARAAAASTTSSPARWSRGPRSRRRSRRTRSTS
jgi:hypothetical protein